MPLKKRQPYGLEIFSYEGDIETGSHWNGWLLGKVGDIENSRSQWIPEEVGGWGGAYRCFKLFAVGLVTHLNCVWLQWWVHLAYHTVKLKMRSVTIYEMERKIGGSWEIFDMYLFSFLAFVWKLKSFFSDPHMIKNEKFYLLVKQIFLFVLHNSELEHFFFTNFEHFKCSGL